MGASNMDSPVSGFRSPVSLKIVLVGHVDHGKSTVIGRILDQTGSLPEGKIEALRASCAAQGRRFEYAFVLDALAEELVHLGMGEAGEEAADVHSRIVDRVEREVIAQVLTECDGVQIKAASRLGINRNTLHKKLKQYGLDGEQE